MNDDLKKSMDGIIANASIEAIEERMEKLAAELEKLGEYLGSSEVNFVACGSCHNKTFAVQRHEDGSLDIICSFPLCGETVDSIREAGE